MENQPSTWIMGQTSVPFRCWHRKSITTDLHYPKSTIAIWWLLPETQADVPSFIHSTNHLMIAFLIDSRVFSQPLAIHCSIRYSICSQKAYI